MESTTSTIRKCNKTPSIRYNALVRCGLIVFFVTAQCIQAWWTGELAVARCFQRMKQCACLLQHLPRRRQRRRFAFFLCKIRNVQTLAQAAVGRAGSATGGYGGLGRQFQSQLAYKRSLFDGVNVHANNGTGGAGTGRGRRAASNGRCGAGSGLRVRKGAGELGGVRLSVRCTGGNACLGRCLPALDCCLQLDRKEHTLTNMRRTRLASL